MSTTLSVGDLLLRNMELSAKHEPFPYSSEVKAAGESLVKILIITCADPRCVPERFLDIKRGDPLAVMRNPGGRVKHSLNDILGLDMLAQLQEIMIIHHTDCGATAVTNEQIREHYVGLGASPQEVANIDTGVFTDLEASVREDVEVLKKAPLIRKDLKDGMSGFVFDIKTGSLSQV